MRAFVIALDAQGRERLGTGRDAGMVSPAYQSRRNLYRYFLRGLPARTYRVYEHHNWERRYGPADRVDTVTIPAAKETV